jgi:hypothetical protein
MTAYKTFILTLNSIGFGSVMVSFRKSSEENEYPFLAHQSFNFALISLADIRECFVMTTENGDDLKLLFAVFKDDFLLLLEKSEGTVHASIDTVIYSLRSECEISKTQDNVLRVQIKSKQKPNPAATLVKSPNSLAGYKYWSLSILFSSTEDATEICNLMRISQKQIIKHIFDPKLEEEKELV